MRIAVCALPEAPALAQPVHFFPDMILPSRQVWVFSAATAVIVVTVLTLVIGRSGGCDDDRHDRDERVTEQGKKLGEAKDRAADHGDRESLTKLTARRQAFQIESEGQLAELAAEIERRGTMPKVPAERVEQLRRDHVRLREQRQRVIDASDAAFEENLLAFNTAVDTIREQLARLDEPPK